MFEDHALQFRNNGDRFSILNESSFHQQKGESEMAPFGASRYRC